MEDRIVNIGDTVKIGNLIGIAFYSDGYFNMKLYYKKNILISTKTSNYIYLKQFKKSKINIFKISKKENIVNIRLLLTEKICK
jgi:hypothetical protein